MNDCEPIQLMTSIRALRLLNTPEREEGGSRGGKQGGRVEIQIKMYERKKINRDDYLYGWCRRESRNKNLTGLGIKCCVTVYVLYRSLLIQYNKYVCMCVCVSPVE